METLQKREWHRMTTVMRVLGSRVSRPDLTRKVLVSGWLLRLLTGPIFCIFSQFYHPSPFIAQQHLWINCQLELSTKLMLAQSSFKRVKQLPYGNPSHFKVIPSCARSAYLLSTVSISCAWHIYCLSLPLPHWSYIDILSISHVDTN